VTALPCGRGLRDGTWVLMDYGDFLVHVFLEDTRLLRPRAPVVRQPHASIGARDLLLLTPDFLPQRLSRSEAQVIILRGVRRPGFTALGVLGHQVRDSD